MTITMERLLVLFGFFLVTQAAPAQQDEKHLPSLATGYSTNVFVLTESVLKTDDVELQKKLAYDVLQAYRDLEHFLAEAYNMIKASSISQDDEKLLSQQYYELVEVIRHSAVDASAQPDGTVKKEELIHAVEKIVNKLRKMTTGVSDDQISKEIISEVSAHAEASMMLLADLYKAVEKVTDISIKSRKKRFFWGFPHLFWGWHHNSHHHHHHSHDSHHHHHYHHSHGHHHHHGYHHSHW